MATMRIGIIGAGTIARDHLRALLALEGVEIVGVVDPVQERAMALAQLAGAPALAEESALYDRRPQAVWLCTPPDLHPDQTVRAAEAGCHVFCEKPIALDLAGADRMIAACRRAGVHLMVGQVIRYYPETLALKRLVEEGALGQPLVVFGRRLLAARPETFPAWRLDPRRSGGFAVESEVHEVDTIRWLGGEVVRVVGQVGYGWAEHPDFDTVVHGLFTLASGAAGLLEASLQSGLRRWEWGVIGHRATAYSPRRGEVRLIRLADQHEEVIPVEPVVDPATGVNRSMQAENREFLEAIRADRPPAIPGEEGRADLAVVLALLQSAREGRPVSLAPAGG